jgi:DNA-binding PadR family transcriptional regulator
MSIDMSIKRHNKNSQYPDMGILQMQILWLLSQKSSHGYVLMKDLSKIKNTKITQGTLYPTLQKLVEHELVKREKKGRKIVYHITAKGTNALSDACTEFCKTFYGIYQDYVCKKCSKK